MRPQKYKANTRAAILLTLLSLQIGCGPFGRSTSDNEASNDNGVLEVDNGVVAKSSQSLHVENTSSTVRLEAASNSGDWAGYNQALLFRIDASPAPSDNLSLAYQRVLPVDLDSDDYIDIVVAPDLISNGSSYLTNVPNRAHVFYNQQGNAFRQGKTIELGNNEYLSDIGDINGDGMPELVVYPFWSNGFKIINGLDATIPEFSYADATFYATGVHGGESYLTDFNGDGITDVIASSNGSLRSFNAHFFKGLNNDDALLEKVYTIEGRYSETSCDTAYYANFHLIDFGYDGNIDLFVEEGMSNPGDGNYLSTCWLMNTGEGGIPDGLTMRLADGITDTIDDALVGAYDVYLQGVSTAFFKTRDNHTIMRRALEFDTILVSHDDFDAEGKNSGTQYIDTGINRSASLLTRTDGGIIHLDMNQDGMLDLLFSYRDSAGNLSVKYLLANSGTSFDNTLHTIGELAVNQILVPHSSNINYAHLNKDGFPDLIMMVAVLLNNEISHYNLRIYLSQTAQ